MQVQRSERFNETLVWETLSSGLRVGILPRPGWREVTGRVAVNYGSIDSMFVPAGGTEPQQVPDGIAHFLEHKLFESEDGDAMTRFAALGAESNAYTSWTQTVYYFTTTENVTESLDILLDMVQEPYFTAETVAKEQGIIEQEIRMYLDHPDWRSRQNLLEAMYHRHPVRVDIAGTVESIHRIDKDLLYLCHRTFYHPSNMLVFVAGDVVPDAVMEQVRKRVDTRGYQPRPPVQRLFPAEPPAPVERRREHKMSVHQPLLRLGFKERRVGEQGEPLLRRELLTGIIIDIMAGKTSDLYTELYEQGLIDQRFGADYHAEPTFGNSVFAGPTRDPVALEQRLLAGIARVRDSGLDERDFERVKRKTLGRYLAMLNSTESIAYLVTDGYFKGIGLFDLLTVAESLTLAEAEARLKEHFDPDYAVTSTIWPLD